MNVQKLYATDETFREVANLLFGGGTDDLVRKMSPSQRKDREKRALTAGLSAVGATAGAAGLGLAAHEINRGYKENKALKVAKPFKASLRSRKLATGLIPLEVAGLGGELMATKILHADTKKPIKKSEPSQADVHSLSPIKGGKLHRMAYGADISVKAAKKGTKIGVEAAQTKGYLKPVKKSAPTDVVWEGEFSKVDTDKRQVFGWASIVKMNGEDVVDLQGDYIDIDEVEKAGYDYVIKSRKGGEMHRRDGDTPVHVSDMIESFIVTPEKIEKMGLPADMPIGWWVGYQINDDDAWNLVKSGKRTGFSIHGRGQRTDAVI